MWCRPSALGHSWSRRSSGMARWSRCARKRCRRTRFPIQLLCKPSSISSWCCRGVLSSIRNSQRHTCSSSQWCERHLLPRWRQWKSGSKNEMKANKNSNLISKIEVPRDVRNSKGPWTWQVQERMISIIRHSLYDENYTK